MKKLFISTGTHTASVSKKGVHVSKITKPKKPKKRCHTESCVAAHFRKARKLGLEWV